MTHVHKHEVIYPTVVAKDGRDMCVNQTQSAKNKLVEVGNCRRIVAQPVSGTANMG